MVERRTGAHVMGDISDRDNEAEAAGIRFGKHRIVEVAGVLAIDSDQCDVAQVGAAAERNCLCGLSLL